MQRKQISVGPGQAFDANLMLRDPEPAVGQQNETVTLIGNRDEALKES